ncbi:NlpC/P60 family protein [Mycobacteroides immunogenum]|uniref:C40 family peptidase n=1 Tax=Mycobacteroides immunogenum TaxID=83262 RepID=UPI0025B74755|nr:NlpC/P60 family protein [Mycobacteroides immunogenum]WJR31920.1 NlpC/P60 family protein [Mycobacteroides immunogenum]
MAKCSDIEHWSDEGLRNVIGTMDNIHKSQMKLGDTLEGVQANLSSWGGLTAEAWHRYHGKVRVDVDEHGHQAKAVADKLRPLYDEVLSIKSQYRYLKSTIVNNGHFDKNGDMQHWKLRDDGTIDTGGSTASPQEASAKQDLEGQMKALLHKADGVDAEIADALKAITTPGGAVADGPHVGQPAPTQQPEPKPEDKHKPDATIAAGALTPADQLPLRAADGSLASPTEATARHDGLPKGGDYLKANPHPSPLLAGLSADEWRKRLATFKPGEPLPDPRTPTGDKAIDAIAHAAGQQGSTYAWGGNQNLDGPSVGHPDDGDGATTFNDPARTGYDCGGLVRYSLSQAFQQDMPNAPHGHDGFVRTDGSNAGAGTDRLDKSILLNPVTDGGARIPSSAVAGVAHPGDVLVFEWPGHGHQAFDGNNTQHTGLYIGNGFMINAHESGEPVQVDSARDDGRRLDVLRIGP